MSKIIDSALDNINPVNKKFIEKNFDIVEEIYALLESNGMSQKDLADKLGKRESEISKWLSGSHNLTLKSIAKIESVFGQDIIYSASSAKKRFRNAGRAQKSNLKSGTPRLNTFQVDSNRKS